MANKLRDEDLQLNIIVNGDKGKKELGDLEKSTRELTTRNKELRAEKEKLLRAGKQETEEYKKVTAEIRENNKTIKANEQRMTELRKEIGLTGLTMKQLRTEQTRLKRLMDSATPGTPQWKQYRNELNLVELQMKKVRAGGKTMQLSMGSIADGFNRFSIMGAAVIGTITGMIFSIRNFISGMVDLDDQLANVMKTTGLTREQVRELYRDFRQMNTRTPRRELLLLAEEAGRLGKKSRQDVMDFVEVANQIKVALGDDLGGEAEVAIREVGKLTDIYKVGEQYGTDFKESMLKVGSAINEVSANSNAQAPYLIEYLKRMGGVAVQADINAASIIGYGSALDQLGQREEMAATAVGKVIVDMFTDTAKYAKIAKMNVAEFSQLLKTDANEAFLKLLDGLNGNNEGFSVMATKLDALGLDGNRAVQVLSALAANTDKIRKEQELANKAMDEGISLTNEYNIKNNNLAASWDKLGQYIHSKFINSGFLGWLEKAVGKMAEWTEIKLADTLIEEQTQLNLLIASITNANNTQETRNSLIAELQEAYPDFLENLDTEKVTNQELRDRLQEVNKEYENRILLAIKEDALKDNYKKRLDLKLDELETIKQIAKYEDIANKAREKVAGETDPNKLRTLLSDQEIAALNAMDLLPKKLADIRSQFTELFDQEAELNNAVEELRTKLTSQVPAPGGGGSRSGGGTNTGGSSTSGNSAIKNAIEEAIAMQGVLSETEKEILASNADALAEIEADVTATMAKSQSEIDKAVDKSIQQSEQFLRFEEQQAEKRKKLYMDVALSIGSTYGDMLANSEKTFVDFSRATLLVALEALHRFFLLKKAEAIIGGIVKGNPLSIAAAVAKVAAMEAVYQGVKGVVSNIGKGKQSGGFTDPNAGENEIVDFVHGKEWIASAPAVQNPSVRQFIDVFEDAQRKGTIRTLNFTDIIKAVSGTNGKQSGGFSASAVSPPYQGGVPAGGGGTEGIYPTINESIIISAIERIVKEIRENPPRLPIDQFEKERDKYIKIQQTKGL